MDLAVKDKVYMVAGASRGLGYGIAEVLAQEGARVAIAGRDGPAVTAAAEQRAAASGAEV